MLLPRNHRSPQLQALLEQIGENAVLLSLKVEAGSAVRVWNSFGNDIARELRAEVAGEIESYAFAQGSYNVFFAFNEPVAAVAPLIESLGRRQVLHLAGIFVFEHRKDELTQHWPRPVDSSSRQAERPAGRFLAENVGSHFIYRWKTNIQGVALQAGDLVDVTHPSLGASPKLMKIEAIEHDEDGQISITATEHVPVAYV